MKPCDMHMRAGCYRVQAITQARLDLAARFIVATLVSLPCLGLALWSMRPCSERLFAAQDAILAQHQDVGQVCTLQTALS